jgi:hypothetical protein
MAETKKKSEKSKTRKNQLRTGKLPNDEKTQMLLMLPDDGSAESPYFDDEDVNEETGGMYLHKEDIKLIHNALKAYKPTEQEEQLLGILEEEFEEILVCDYNEIAPWEN